MAGGISYSDFLQMARDAGDRVARAQQPSTLGNLGQGFMNFLQQAPTPQQDQPMPADWENRFRSLQDLAGPRQIMLGERRQDLPMALQPDMSIDAAMPRQLGQAQYFPNMGNRGQFYSDLTRNSLPTMDDLMPFLRGSYQPQQAPMMPRTLGDLYR